MTLSFPSNFLGKIIIGLCCSLGVVSPLFTQYQNISFSHINLDDGLSQSTVRKINQDSFGFMWFGTADGLNKYDGRKISVYRSIDNDTFSLPSSFINDIFEEDKSRLWISTGGGLCYLDRKMDKFFPVFPDKIQRNIIPEEMKKDAMGNLWLSAQNGVLYKKAKDSNTFTAYRNDHSSSRIQDFIILKNGLFWISYEDAQVFEFNPTKGTYTLIRKMDYEIFSLFEDIDSKIWMGTNGGGIIIYNQKNKHWASIKNDPNNSASLPDNTIRCIAKGLDDNLIITTNAGLAISQKNNNTDGEQSFQILKHRNNDSKSICSNLLYQIYRDKDQVFWIGSTDAGMSIWNTKAQRFNHIYQKESDPHGINNNVIWSFEEDEKGNFWIGTSKGLNYFDPKTGKTQHYIHEPLKQNSLPNNRIWQIIKADKNQYWLATRGGVTSMKIQADGSPSFQTYYPQKSGNYSFGNIRSLMLDHRGNVWVGTGNGLYLFDQNNKTYQGYLHDPHNTSSISGNDVRVIFEDSHRNIWVGTRAGLNRFEPVSGTFERFNHDIEDSTSINDNIIRCIREDDEGRIWIGTSRGLNEMIHSSHSEKITFDALTLEDGLPNETIYAMEVDDEGYLWLSTNNGLSKFDTDERKFLNFHSHLGLQSHEFNSLASLKTRSGHLLFGGINGFNYFHPQEVDTDKINTPILFTDIQVNYHSVGSNTRYLSQHINLADHIELEYTNDKMFNLEFTALDLLHSETRKYAYRLLPYQAEWIEVGHINNASYTNIAPGEYIFQVRSSDINNVWSDATGTIQVNIRPAYWQTTWFKILMVLLIGGTIYVWYQNRVRSIVNRQNELEKMVGERTNEINQQKVELEGTLNVLKKAQIKLVESEKMASLGLLTAGIAHEINNPVNYINTSAEALVYNLKDLEKAILHLRSLKKGEHHSTKVNDLIDLAQELDLSLLQEESLELVDNIKDGSQRVASIVQSLKTFTYQSNGILKEADLNKVIESSLIILNHKIKQQAIQVINNLQPIPMVLCEVGKVNQVFINIIDNAIGAMEDEGKLTLSSFEKDNQVVVEIQDEGKGMDEITLKHIFDPFYTTKDIGEGTGLGMAISYGIIQDQKGKIEVESEVGKGTLIRVILPLSKSNECEDIIS